MNQLRSCSRYHPVHQRHTLSEFQHHRHRRCLWFLFSGMWEVMVVLRDVLLLKVPGSTVGPVTKNVLALEIPETVNLPLNVELAIPVRLLLDLNILDSNFRTYNQVVRSLRCVV